MSRFPDSNLGSPSQPTAETSKAGSLGAVLAMVVIVVCILSCGLMLLVPTGSIDTTTVYRGF